jgi:Type III restriction enzyme, res subunit
MAKIVPIKVFILREGAVIERQEFTKAFGEGPLGQLMAKLMVKYGQIGAPKVIKMFRDMGQLIIFPRFIGVALTAAGMTEAVVDLPCRPMEIKVRAELTLNDEQARVADYLMADVFNEDRLESGSASCNLQMKAGTGKTYLGLEIIKRLAQRALWITPRRFLAEQTKNVLAKYIEGVAIYDSHQSWREGGPQVPTEGQVVTIIVINSAIKEDKAFFDQFGLIIFDEVHMYCGSEYSNIFWKAQAAYCLGLSATMEHRKDKFDVIYYKHLGPVIKAEDILLGADGGPKFTCMAQIVHYKGPKCDVYLESTGKLFTPAIIKAFASDNIRNELIVNKVVDLFNNGRYIYVFSEFRWHIELLKAAFLQRVNKSRSQTHLGTWPIHANFDASEASDASNCVLIESNEDIKADDEAEEAQLWSDGQIRKGMALKGGATANDMNNAAKTRVIFTTYGYAGTGISIVHMDSAIFATPRRNGYEQICARVMRRGSDVAIKRLFVDIVDDNSALRWQLKAREAVYKMYGFDIEHLAE